MINSNILKAWNEERIRYQIRYAKTCIEYHEDPENLDIKGHMHEQSWVSLMNLEETIIFANNMVKTKYHHGMVQMGNLNDDEANFYFEEAKSYKQLAKWLEELKELREYKEKYRWHDLRKNPDDVPDVPHPESTWFEVVQEDNEEEIPRAAMQYDDEYGFGFYQEIYAARSFGYVDTEFKTVEELNLAPVVAWKAIEEFESEEEDADINRK